MTRRLVALGRKKAGFRTITMKIDSRSGEAEGLISWFPKLEITDPEPDYDLVRKQRIEDAIARGDDL